MRKRTLGLLTPFLLPLGLADGCLVGGCVSEGAGWSISVGSPFRIEFRQYPDAKGEFKNRTSFDPEGAGIVHAFLGDTANDDGDKETMPVVVLTE